jgi:low affinity Fe/Cu permease
MKETFRKLAYKTSEMVGSAPAFLIALATVFVWGITGPVFGYSDTWQLVINTGTTIVTFLMVFLIQHTQNRDAKILQLKIDELIRAVSAARTKLVGLEDLPDEEIDRLQKEFQRLAKVREKKREKTEA